MASAILTAGEARRDDAFFVVVRRRGDVRASCASRGYTTGTISCLMTVAVTRVGPNKARRATAALCWSWSSCPSARSVANIGSSSWVCTFSQSVAIIQSQVGVIRGVQVLYSDLKPLNVDIVINMPLDGIRLIFDPVAQRLKIIEVYNMKLVKLKYCGAWFNSPEVPPSIEQVEHSFGATHPGLYDSERQMFALNFRGLSFYFPIDSKFEPGYAHGLGSFQFPNGASPVVSRTTIYHGAHHSQTNSSDASTIGVTTPELPLTCYYSHLYLSRCDVLRDRHRTTGIRLHLYTEGTTRSLEPARRALTRCIIFGERCQDVARSLGAPSRVFYKAEDKMRIHSPQARRRHYAAKSDYFFNYFTLGLDVLFDARTQKVKKLVLHTNYPGHYNFNMYHRCEFHLPVPPERSASDKLIDVSPSPMIVSAYSRWEQVAGALRPSERPVVLNRASSTNTTNPFGSTFCYGYQDIIFEVMPNNYIASVTLYHVESPEWESEEQGVQAGQVGQVGCARLVSNVA